MGQILTYFQLKIEVEFGIKIENDSKAKYCQFYQTKLARKHRFDSKIQIGSKTRIINNGRERKLAQKFDQKLKLTNI